MLKRTIQQFLTLSLTIFMISSLTAALYLIPETVLPPAAAYGKVSQNQLKKEKAELKKWKKVKVANIKAKAVKKGAIVSWSKVKGAKRYYIYVSTKKNGKYIFAGETTKKTRVKITSHWNPKDTLGDDIPLKSGKRYYFKVAAVKFSDFLQENGKVKETEMGWAWRSSRNIKPATAVIK